MDISALQEIVSNQADSSDDNIGLRLLVAKLGQLAEVSIGLEDVDLSDEEVEEAMGDLLAGLLVIVAHAAMEQGVDLDAAVTERISVMQERSMKQDEMEQAMEDLDFEKIANELGLLEENDEEENDEEENDEEENDEDADDFAFADNGSTERMFY